MVGVGIYVWTFEHLCSMRLNSVECFIEAVCLKPQHDTIAVGLGFRIAQVWMAMRILMVKLHDHPAVVHELFVVRAAMAALIAKHSLVPQAARSNITHCDEWLRVHAHSK
jgi:hypothetical protein